MNRVIKKVVLLALLNPAYLAQAESIPAVEPVPANPVVEIQDAARQSSSALAVKYVRNVTSPNGFGESIVIDDAVFYAKAGDVKAETGDKLEYAIVISSSGSDFESVAVRDFIPAYTEYVPDSTAINNINIADVESKSPLLGTMLVNDPDSALHSGIIRAGSSAVVKFRVRVNLMLDVPEI